MSGKAPNVVKAHLLEVPDFCLESMTLNSGKDHWMVFCQRNPGHDGHHFAYLAWPREDSETDTT